MKILISFPENAQEERGGRKRKMLACGGSWAMGSIILGLLSVFCHLFFIIFFLVFSNDVLVKWVLNETCTFVIWA